MRHRFWHLLTLAFLALLLVPLGCGGGGGGGSAEGGQATTPGLGGSMNLRLVVQVPPSERISLQTFSSSQSVRVEVTDRQTGTAVVSLVEAEVPAGASQVEVPVFGVPAGLWRVSVRLLSNGVPVGSPAVADVEILPGRTTRVALSLTTVTLPREFVLAANAGSDTLSVFQADLTTSVLTHISGSPFSTGSATGPSELVLDPQGEFFYVTLESSNHVAQYRLDATTGVPTFVSQFATGSFPRGIAMDPLGNFLYVTNLGDTTLSGYAIDSVTGALTELSGSPFPVAGGQVPQTVYIEPLGRFLYVGEGNLISKMYAFRIDSGTGNLTQEGGAIPAGPPGNRIFAFQATPAGDVLYVTGSFSDILGFDINPTTGAVTAKTGFPVATPDTALGGMQLDPIRSVLYVTGFFGNSVLAYPVTTGGTLGALLPGTPVSTGDSAPLLMVLNPTREALYVTNNNSSGTVAAFRLGTGGVPAAVSGSPFPSGANTFGIDVVRFP